MQSHSHVGNKIDFVERLYFYSALENKSQLFDNGLSRVV